MSIDFTNIHKSQVGNNSFTRKLRSVMKSLNFKDVNQYQIFTFCKDPYDQVLYITQPDDNKIVLILMRDHHCEECYDSSMKPEDKIQYEIGQGVLDMFKIGMRASRVSKKSRTRMKKLTNYCLPKHNITI